MSDIYEQSKQIHRANNGKIKTIATDKLDTREKLSLYYTPGMGGVAQESAAGREVAKQYSYMQNALAVVSDGSAVLGFGDIGPFGALPVMEGKAMIFKEFANIDAIPIVLKVHTVDGIVATVKALSPSFSAINLEDIAAPKCFAIEERLKAELDIPVMHDDQHGTAIVVLAALINACKVAQKDINNLKIVLLGAGAAGVAVAKLIHLYSTPEIICVDSKGIISNSRAENEELNPEKIELLSFSSGELDGDLSMALKGADIFIGLSGPDLLKPEMIKNMSDNPIIFAMANPVPEIMPDLAKTSGAFIVATGRSDFPNQINNVLAFPGVFRGALDNGIKIITDQHKINAALALADLVESPDVENILPSALDQRVVPAIAKVII